MNADSAPLRPARRPGSQLPPNAGVADPSRGTRVAVGMPLAGAAAAAAWLAHAGWSLGTSLPIALALMGAAAAAERLVFQIGPRSWYTASAPAVVLAALLGGPLLGVAAGISTQVVRSEAVWRRRLAEGGLASLQGIAAGVVGSASWSSGTGATAVAAGAMAAAVAVNSAGRALIMLERRAHPFRETWLRGFLVDVLEMVLLTPLLAVLLLASESDGVLVVATAAALLTALTIAQRSREATAVALAAEQENARRDQLTGAPNRRAFEEAMAAEHARIVRGALPAGLFVVDIDHFKSINDRFGHRVGDEVLIEGVRRLSDGLRPSDVVARWGGEEITVLAPGVRGRRQLEQFAERIRSLVADRPIATTTAAVPITVSVGGTLLDGSVAPLAALHRADEAMYAAKRTRDATAVSLPPLLTLRLESV
ncbi:diguanylate cyclase [Gaiella occulta]|uniref:diguanylate cyclase n=1 Tax=Gaiella occulta TaxID=1002870 RepID=UPI000E0A9CD0|nr:GGDEF domain-containing protein [Gaiella occulta]